MINSNKTISIIDTEVKNLLQNSLNISKNTLKPHLNLIDELVNQYQPVGQYEYNWSPENIASGLYALAYLKISIL